jgi:hypothetical protein
MALVEKRVGDLGNICIHKNNPDYMHSTRIVHSLRVKMVLVSKFKICVIATIHTIKGVHSLRVKSKREAAIVVETFIGPQLLLNQVHFYHYATNSKLA